MPSWFASLVAPKPEALPHIILPSPARAPGLIIEADPTDEIREVWEEVHTFLWIGGGIFLLVCGLLYVVLRRGLQPLAELLTAFERLTNDDFTARVSQHTVPELSRIHHEFNRMAEVLGATVQHRRRAERGHSSGLDGRCQTAVSCRW